MAIKIAEYTFKSGYDTLPAFNSGYTYNYTDVDNRNGTITRTITSDTLPTKISFDGKYGLVSLSYLDTSDVTDMGTMFKDCANLTTLDLSSFNTSKVTGMYSMFANNPKLKSIEGLSSFNTSKVTNMYSMFSDCPKLTTLDLSSFNTSKVTNISYMFWRSTNLTTLDLSSFDTSKVTDMSWMFDGCSNLISLDLSNFNPSKTADIFGMFDGCRSLTTIYMGNNTDSLNNMIKQLPTKTSNDFGTIIVPKGVLNSVDATTANSKYWNVVKEPEYAFTLDTLKYLLTNIKNKFVAKEELDNKVDKVEGKQLSTNNFTDEDMNNIYNSFNDAEVNQNGTIISFYSTSENGVKTKVKDINLDI